MKRFLAGFLTWLPTGAGVLLVLVLAQTASAQDDRTYLQALLEDNLSDAGREVRITGFTGALSSRATIEQLTIADADGIWLTLKGAVLDWNRGALLRGRLEIGELSATELLLPRMPRTGAPADATGITLPDLPAPEARDFKLPELPVSIDIAKLAIARVTLGEALFGEAAVVSMNGAAALNAGQGDASLGIKRVDNTRGELGFAASLSNATGILDLSFRLSEAADGIAANLIGLPGRPSVDLTIAGKGPLKDYAADIALTTDGQPNLTGRVALVAPQSGGGTHVFNARLGGDLRPLVQPEYRKFLGPDIRLLVSGTRPVAGGLRLDTMSLTSDALTLKGQLTLGADYWPEKFGLDGRIASDDGGDVLLSIPGPPTRIRSALIAMQYDAARNDAWSGTLNVDRLQRDGLSLGALQLGGGGRLSPGNGAAIGVLTGALDLSARGIAPADPALAQAIGEMLSGRVSFNWREDAPLEFSEVSLSGQDYSVAGDLSVQGLQDRLNLTAAARFDLVAQDLSRFAGLVGRPLRGAADLNIAGTGAPLDGAFDIRLEGGTRDLGIGVPLLDRLIAGASVLGLSARRDETGTHIDRLNITATGAVIEASGELKTSGSDLKFDLRLPDAALMEPGLSGPAQVIGTARQTGDDWAVRADLTAPGGVAAALDATLAISGDTIGDVTGTAVMSVADLGPYGFVAGRPLSGSAQLRAEGATNLQDGTFSVTARGRGSDLGIGIDEVDRLLRGQSRLAVDLRRESSQVIVVDRFNLGSDHIVADLTGSSSAAKSRVRYSVDLVDIGLYAPGLTGPATMAGTAEATGGDWDIQADLTAPGGVQAAIRGQLAVVDNQIGTVIGSAVVNADSLSPYAPVLGRPVGGSIAVNADGRADLQGGTFGLSLRGTGDNLRVGPAEIDLLLVGQSQLALDMRRETGQVIVLDQFNLKSPRLIADLTGSTSPAKSRVRFSVDLADIGLYAPGLNGPATMAGVAASEGGDWQLTSNMTGPGGTRAAVSGAIAPDASRVNLDISGAAPLALANPYIAPNLASGQVEFKMAMNGPPALESVSGTARSDGATLVVPSQKISFSGLSADARLGNGRAEISVTANLSSGGRIAVSGPVGLGAPYPADLAIVLSSIGVTQPGLYETTVDGRIAARGPLAGGATIAGDLTLGPVEMRVPDAVGAASGALPGLQHVNEPAAVRQTRARAGLLDSAGLGAGSGPAYPLDITVSAPSRIFVRGRGLDVEMGGRLRLLGTTADVVTQGRFDLVRGRLDILGKRLALTEGIVRLQGDFDPYLRIVAETESGGVSIRIVIEGLASSPEITFTSSPDLPEDEVVARLLFGRDLSQISPLQALQIASAINTLAGNGKGGIVNRLRQNFGLDDLDITRDTNGETAVKAGKYISENIYTDVTVNSSGQSEINLNLSITPSLTARGTAGSDGNTGLGLFFEKNY
ncbi:MAG: translocation/assembly module TamB domain-containing protein [Rhodobacter sp.]|nr:translocation/assembly module TamB domain-containing protein [Rhodobacter sp.]